MRPRYRPARTVTSTFDYNSVGIPDGFRFGNFGMARTVGARTRSDQSLLNSSAQ